MARKKSDKPHFPRRKWSRDPIQKPHSTPHGKKGYDRKRQKEELERRIENEENTTGEA